MNLKTPSRTPLEEQENITNSEHQLQLNLNQEKVGQKSIEWAAGLFEGEGTITHHSNRPDKPKLAINMTDLDVMQSFATSIGYGNVTGPYPYKTRPQNKPCYRWEVGKKVEVIRILKLLLPFFGKRRKQRAEQALYQLLIK